MTTITVDEMKNRIGTETVSDWVEVTQEMIDKFADATGDHQFIHIDPEKAAMTPFGGTDRARLPDAVADAAAVEQGRRCA